MVEKLILSCFIFYASFLCAQRDALEIGDRYAEDQLYVSISYAQLNKQPSIIGKSNFSYSFSTGFMKDIILNRQGTFAIAGGAGLGYSLFSHQLKVDEVNGATVFENGDLISDNVFSTFNLEVPIELRWRTSTANKYSFWRVYTGIKFLYNLNNSFRYLDANQVEVAYKNVSAFENLQYGLTLSAGYDEFNINFFYGLNPIFKNASINGEVLGTRILQFGLIFYLL